MKKLIAMLVTVLCAVPMIVAQESVSGVVVDETGNPLPGVRLEISGSQNWIFSDLDGTFTISNPLVGKGNVYASYAGLRPQKAKIKDGMKIIMRKDNWWTKKPDKWSFFAETLLAIPNDPIDGHNKVFNPAYGIMLGRIKNYGYYLKGLTNTFGEKFSSGVPTEAVEKQKSTYWSATGGGLVRLGCPIHLYLGLGYAEYNFFVTQRNGETFIIDDRKRECLVGDLGLLFRFNKVTVSLGITSGEIFNPKKYDHTTSGNFGIGYIF